MGIARTVLASSKANNFETKRQFTLDYIEKIVYWNDKVELYGHIPVKLKMYDDKNQNTELAKIEFCIKDIIPRLDRMGTRNPYGSHHSITKAEYKQFKK